MSRHVKRFWSWFLIASVVLTGCHPLQPSFLNEDGDLSHFLDVATEIEHPDVDLPILADVTQTQAPFTVTNPHVTEMWELSLEDAISIALQNSKVVRQIRARGSVIQLAGAGTPEFLTLNAGQGVPTVYDPAIQESGPNGVEQALAVFDAQLSTNLFWDRTDRPQNFGTAFTPIFVRLLQQDTMNTQTEISKRTATGSQWFARSISIYDDTNSTNRALASDWFQGFEFEARQPLLRGRGTQINRIPIVIARIQTDLALHDFEINVRNMVSDVERAYWALYFSYRNLEATKIGRDSALATWKRIYALYDAGAPGGEAENEAQSREQYFFFRARVEGALNTLFRSEKQLRYLLGLTATDGRLIRPADEPTTAKVKFDWGEILSEASVRSPEIRRQKWTIKQRDLELIAARNQLLPQLDLVAIYRFLGLGDQLFGNSGFEPGTSTPARFPDANTTAWDELLGGDYQEGRLGLQLTMPIGFRAELANVRNRELVLAREKAVLEDMELEVSHQLTDAIQDLESLYAQSQTNLNRIRAAVQEVEAIQAAYDAGTATLDRLLDAQRRRSDAEVSYYQTLSDYNLAILQVHFRKGSLLEYDGIVLAEGPWPTKAYFDAHTQARRRDASYYLDYGFSRPKVISRGPVDQHRAEGFISDEVQFPESAIEGSQQVPLEPIPAPEPANTSPLPAPEPTWDGDLSDTRSPDVNRSAPVLSPPKLTGDSERPKQLSAVAHTETDFDWGTMGLETTPIADEATQTTAAETTKKPAQKANQLKWK